MISCRELARRMFPRIFVEAIIFAVLSSAILVAEPALKLLAFYSTNVESDHQITPSRSTATWRQRTISSSMSPWAGASSTILWLNDFPKMSQQHAAFERYREHGGGWIGFHLAGYNNMDTHWPWFVELSRRCGFLQQQLAAASCETDGGRSEQPTESLPASFISPANEWYLWKPSPRLSKQVRCP